MRSLGDLVPLPRFPKRLEDGLQNRPHRYVAGGFSAFVLASAAVGLGLLPMWAWILLTLVSLLAVMLGGLVMYSRRTHPAFSG